MKDVSKSAAEVQQVLDERARELARPRAKSAGTEIVYDVVTFSLAGETYALETRFVHEVCRLGSFVQVPGASRAFLGVTVHRGEVLPIVDLRELLGIRTRGLGELSRLLLT